MNTPEAVEGSMVLRAKLDMANPNMHFRDPIIYRIIQTPHHRTGTKWHAYPMYDFAHGQSDYFEGVTHSICTLEFVPHRPLYDKFVDELMDFDKNTTGYRPRQIEFNRLNLTYTVMSKRKLKALVEEHLVNGWDDPRMPTVCGMRRRGYSPQSIRKFIDSIGYTKFDALNDMALLEAAVREDLNMRATRVSAVLNPVKLVITNYPEGQTEEMVAVNNPENEAEGTHTITFSRNLWIEREDFMEDAPSKFFRMTPGKEVRLKNAYIIMCTGCTKDADGNITEIQATYDPESKSGMAGANRKVKGTLHWVSADHCKKAEVRIYDRLFNVENPSADERDFRELLNPESLKTIDNCYVEAFELNNTFKGVVITGNTAAGRGGGAAAPAPTQTYAAPAGSGGADLVNYANQFVGNSYKWGGTSLTNGADCSGFVQSVYANYGYSLPRTAAQQSGAGTEVSLSDIQAGDLLFYSNGGDIGHVAIYEGNGQIVHASNSRDGIKTSSYDYRTPVKAVRVIGQ